MLSNNLNSTAYRDSGPRREVGTAAAALAGLVIFVSIAPLTSQGSVNGTMSGEGNAFRQLSYLTVLALALWDPRFLRRPANLLVLPVSVCLPLAWFAMSIFWALNPGVAVRRLFLTSIIIWSVFLAVERIGYSETIRVVRFVLPLVLASNFIAVIGWPQWAIHQSAIEADQSIVGAWRGIMLQKNFAGAACAFTLIFFLFDSSGVRPTLRYLLLLASAYFLYRTNSKTSIGVLSLSCGIAWLYRYYQARYLGLAIHLLLILLFLTAVTAYLNWDVLLAPFSGEDALTGRVQIWPILFAYWNDHKWLGSGYGSFWNVGETNPIYQYTRGWVANITSAHNGYLDLLAQTGIPGLVLTLFALVIAPIWKFLSSEELDRTRGALLIAAVLFSALHNLTESSAFERDAIVQLFFMISLALLSHETRRNR